MATICKTGIDFLAPITKRERTYLIASYLVFGLFILSSLHISIVAPDTLEMLYYFQQLVTGLFIMWCFRPTWLPLIGRKLPLTRLEYDLAFTAGFFLVLGLMGEFIARWNTTKAMIADTGTKV